MELSLRSLKTVLLLKVTGEVSVRDLAILSVGLQVKAPKTIPVLIDLEKSRFLAGAHEGIENLLDKAENEGIRIFIVSARLKKAYARTLKEALEKIGNPNTPVITEILKLDDDIIQLKSALRALEAELSRIMPESPDRAGIAAAENTALEWLVNSLQSATEQDRSLYLKFLAEVKRREIEPDDPDEPRLEAIEYLESRGISCSPRGAGGST